MGRLVGTEVTDRLCSPGDQHKTEVAAAGVRYGPPRLHRIFSNLFCYLVKWRDNQMINTTVAEDEVYKKKTEKIEKWFDVGDFTR